MSDPITNLITIYHDLNPSVVEELDTEPTPLEFLRYVSKNRPFVVRKAVTSWPAFQKWNAEYLRERMKGREVKVAVTEKGNADAVIEHADGSLVMVEPHEVSEDFGSFLDELQTSSSRRSQDEPPRLVNYAQTQDGNLPTEYSALLPDVPADISFAREALDQPADAINFWLGNGLSTTALHKDNYENVYLQIRGQKHFVLLSPMEMPCVNEQPVRRGRYVPRPSSSPEPEAQLGLEVCVDDAAAPIPAPTWDPDAPSQRTTPYSHLASPLRVTLEEGDLLYLPSMWYHKVSQSGGDEGFACAVNYWYDMEFAGQGWAVGQFVREVCAAREEVSGGGAGEVQVDYGKLDSSLESGEIE